MIILRYLIIRYNAGFAYPNYCENKMFDDVDIVGCVNSKRCTGLLPRLSALKQSLYNSFRLKRIQM